MSNICMISFGNLEEPRNGYVLRCWMLTQRLIKEGHDVTVYQFSDKDDEVVREGVSIHSIGVKHERPAESVLEKFIGFNPFRELLFPFEGYARLRKLRPHLAHFDEFYIESCMLGNALAVVKPLKKIVTIDTHCMNKDVALKIKEHDKLSGTIRTVIWHVIEKNMLRFADKVIAISENDRRFMRRHYDVPDAKISVIPHVVDPAAADKHRKEAESMRKQFLKNYRRIACFIGDLGAIQNVASENFITKKLAPATPDIHYVIIGNNPKGFKSRDNITYTGFVDAIDPYVMMADVCIAPMAIGSGVKTKVLDYLKYDKRIIATPVAVEGIDPSGRTTVCELDEFLTKIKKL